MANYPFSTLGDKPLLDTAKTNQLSYPVEGEDDPLAKINENIESGIQHLENRYANPNWFKVSAGFLKPQLGGFGASLGSAFEALGENQEQQKALEIPLFKMRTELATNAAIMGRNKTVNDKIATYKKQHNELPSPQLLAEWQAQASEATGTKAMTAMTKSAQEQQTLAAQQNQIAIQKISEERQMLEGARSSGLITGDEYNEKLKTLMARASALNSPSDVVTNTNYTPTPQKVPVNGGTNAPVTSNTTSPATQVMPAGVLSDAKIPNIPDALKATIPSSMSSLGKPVPQEAQPYQYVSQALKPSGQPDAYYKTLSENRVKDAGVHEDRTNAILQSYQPAADPVIANNYKNAIVDLNKMQKNPLEKEAFAQFHNLVRSGGPLAAAVQKGLLLHFGNFSANLSLPVDAYKQAGLDPKYWTTVDRILSNYSILANTHMMMDGIKQVDPNAQADINMLSKYAHISQTPSAALHAARDNYVDFAMRRRIMQELPRIKNKILAEHPDELAPTTAAYKSKEIEDIQNLYADARKLELEKLRAGQHDSRKLKNSKRD